MSEALATQASEEERISQQYRTVQQIANSYPVGEKRLYKAIKDGELRRVKIGNRVLLREAVVQAWLRSQEGVEAAP